EWGFLVQTLVSSLLTFCTHGLINAKIASGFSITSNRSPLAILTIVIPASNRVSMLSELTYKGSNALVSPYALLLERFCYLVFR
ncbi:hypothetical protein, partial [Escherichia coli]|uniref:hypothetical protein n=1 Tax=Escherichia coli TaxID=562 RepID=UPI003F198C83